MNLPSIAATAPFFIILSIVFWVCSSLCLIVAPFLSIPTPNTTLLADFIICICALIEGSSRSIFLSSELDTIAGAMRLTLLALRLLEHSDAHSSGEKSAESPLGLAQTCTTVNC